VHSVVFRLTDAFNPNDPDYGWMHRKVERTLAKAFAPDEPRPGPGPTHGAGPRPRASAGATPPAPDASATAAPERPAHDPCAYHPVG
jgi:hypothetical protein